MAKEEQPKQMTPEEILKEKQDELDKANAAIQEYQAKQAELEEKTAALEDSKKELEELKKQTNASAQHALHEALRTDFTPELENNLSNPSRKVRVFINSRDNRYQVESGDVKKGQPKKFVSVRVNGKEFHVPCDAYVEVPIFVANLLHQGEVKAHPEDVQAEVFKPEVFKVQ